MASLIVTTTMSPRPPWRRLDPPSTRITRAVRAPELSAILTIDSCWITLASPTAPARRSQLPAIAWSSTGGASPRCAPCRRPWRPARRAPPPAWCGAPASRTGRARSAGPSRPSRSSASCPSPPRRCGPCACLSCGLPLAQNGADPREVAADRAEAERILHRLGRGTEPQPEPLVGELDQLALQVLDGELAQVVGPLPRHASAPPAGRTST